MASDLNGKVVTGVFLLGIGLGSTIGWHPGSTLGKEFGSNTLAPLEGRVEMG